MYDQLCGEVLKKTPTSLVVDVQGIGFLLEASLRTTAALALGAEVRVLVHHRQSEDAVRLFGFVDESRAGAVPQPAQDQRRRPCPRARAPLRLGARRDLGRDPRRQRAPPHGVEGHRPEDRPAPDHRAARRSRAARAGRQGRAVPGVAPAAARRDRGRRGLRARRARLHRRRRPQGGPVRAEEARQRPRRRRARPPRSQREVGTKATRPGPASRPRPAQDSPSDRGGSATGARSDRSASRQSRAVSGTAFDRVLAPISSARRGATQRHPRFARVRSLTLAARGRS